MKTKTFVILFTSIFVAFSIAVAVFLEFGKYRSRVASGKFSKAIEYNARVVSKRGHLIPIPVQSQAIQYSYQPNNLLSIVSFEINVDALASWAKQNHFQLKPIVKPMNIWWDEWTNKPDETISTGFVGESDVRQCGLIFDGETNRATCWYKHDIHDAPFINNFEVPLEFDE